MQAVLAILRQGARRVEVEEAMRATAACLLPPWPGHTTVHAEDGVGLAVRTPTHVDEEPALERDGARVVVWDGRIDARAELAASLGLNAADASGVTAGALLLRAHETWGPSFPARLVGDFAFLLWDGAAKQLLAARDVFGTRPLVWARTSRGLALSSEVGALLGVAGVRRDIHEARIADAFFDELEAVDETSTFYEGVERLPPGRVLVASGGGIRVEPYDGAVFDPSKALKLDDDQAYEARFRDTFRAAVADRLPPAGRTGVMLSGGIDSGSIACVARDVLAGEAGPPLPVFSGVSEDETGCKESGHIREVMATGGMDATVRRPSDVVRHHADARYILDHTHDLFDTRLLEVRGVLYGAARRSGLVALLDGIDGDLAISLGADAIGYAARMGRWRSVWREARQFARVWNQSAWGYIWGYAIRPRRPELLARTWRMLRGDRRPRVPWEGSIINPDFARRVDVEARFRQRYAEDPASVDLQQADQRQRHLRNLRSPLIPAALERYHRAASWHGLEARHPFFDRRLAALTLSMPLTQKIRGGWPKSILRRAMAGTVPDGVRWRVWGPNLSPLFWKEVLQVERPMIDEVLVGNIDDASAYIDVNKVRTALERWHQRGDPVEGFRAWQATVLVSWLRRV